MAVWDCKFPVADNPKEFDEVKKYCYRNPKVIPYQASRGRTKYLLIEAPVE